MQLDKKRNLASRTLNVGRERIIFNKERLAEIKESITKQDIRDLVKEKAIMVAEIKGKRQGIKRKTRKRSGSVKKKVKKSKKKYMQITRKLRSLLSELKKKDKISSEEYWRLRKEIRARAFNDKAHFKERLNQFVKERR